MKLTATPAHLRALAASSLARPRCLLRPAIRGVFFRRLVPIHLDRTNPLVRRLGTELVHVLVDARRNGASIETKALGACRDTSLDSTENPAPLFAPISLDLDANVALKVRLRRVFGLFPPAPFERYPSTWEAVVTVILGGKVAGSRGPGPAVLEHRNALARAFGTVVMHDGTAFGALPDPLGLKMRMPQDLERVGLPDVSARRLVSIARDVADQRLDLGSLFGKSFAQVARILEPIDGLSTETSHFICAYGAACSIEGTRPASRRRESAGAAAPRRSGGAARRA